MAYLIRKISNKANVEELREITSVKDVKCDLVKKEFNTQNNCLSTYYIDSLDKENEAILAIALTGDHLEKFDYIVIDEGQCKQYGFEHKSTHPGCEVPIKNLDSEHHDIVGLTYGKIENVLECYQETASKENSRDRIKRCNNSNLRELVCDAYRDNRIDIERIKSKNIVNKINTWLAS